MPLYNHQQNDETDLAIPSPVPNLKLISENGETEPTESQSSSLNLFDDPDLEPVTSIKESSFNNLAELKIQTSLLAMHLKSGTRGQIFSEIDYLLDPKEFDLSEDSLISVASFNSYLRFLTYSPNVKSATLAVTFGGEVIALWVANDGKCKRTLNLEFLPNDRVKCSFSCVCSGEMVEALSYIGSIKRIDEILTPYNAVSLYKYGI